MVDFNATTGNFEASQKRLSAEIIHFPQKMQDELLAVFISENQEFIRNHQACGSVDFDHSFLALEDMENCEETGYDWMKHGTLYGKILDMVKMVPFSKEGISVTGYVTFQTYTYVWKILFFNESGYKLTTEIAMESKNIQRKLAFLLPAKLSN